MDRLLITSIVLDKLGFSEYCDEDGDWGGRTLTFQNGIQFRIMEQCEIDDDTYGYGDGKYISHHYCFGGFFAWPKIEGNIHHDLFFIHEMYECLEKHYPSCLEEFIFKLKALKMYTYIEQFLKERK